MEASVGGFAVGIAAGCVARKFELLNSFRGVVTRDCRDHPYDRSGHMVYLSPPLLDLSTAGVEFVTVLVKGLKLSGLSPVEAVEGKLPES
jgi:hypothetical protein